MDEKTNHKILEIKFEEKADLYYLYIRLAEDEKGVLCKIALVLFSHNIEIIQAGIKNKEKNSFTDFFILRPDKTSAISKSVQKSIRRDIERLLQKEIETLDYLHEFPDKESHVLRKITENSSSNVHTGKINNREAELIITSKDRPGLLFQITHVLFLLYVDIVKFDVSTDNSRKGFIRDRFIIRREDLKPLNDRSLLLLINTIKKVI